VKLALHSDPAVRAALPRARTTVRFLGVSWAVTVIAVVAATLQSSSGFAVLTTLLPIGYLFFLATRLARLMDAGVARFWRVLSIGLVLVALTFVVVGLRGIVDADVVFVALGLLVPSAIFFLTYGMWIRLQASLERPSTLGFFDVVLVVAVGFAYVSFLMTSDVFLGAGQGFGLGVFILVSCVVILLMTLMLVGRRRRDLEGGVGVEVVFAIVLVLSVGAVGIIFAWNLISTRPLLEMPPWILVPTWTLVFSVSVLAPYAEDTRTRLGSTEISATTSLWPYLLLALTPPIAIGSLMSTQRQQKVAGIVGLLLVVEVLVVRQLVLIGEQRRARFRQRRLRDLATAEAARTNVILDLALTLARFDDPRAMCDAVAAAVAALEADAAVAVFGRLDDGRVAAATKDVDDPGEMYAMLGRLRLTSSRCIHVAGPWIGTDPGTTALVAAVMGAAGDRLGYVVVVPAGFAGEEHRDLVDSIGGVADQLALALDRAGLLEAVRADAERVRESVDHLSEGVAVVGPDDRVRACNDAFATLLGIDAIDLVGAPLPSRILARLPMASGAAETTADGASWSSEVDFGTVDEPRRVQVTVLVSPTDPLDDGVVLLVEGAPVPDERERLLGLLDDLVGADTGSQPHEAAIAGRLTLGLRERVEAPLAGVRTALDDDSISDATGLTAAVDGARDALRALYTEAAREVSGR